MSTQLIKPNYVVMIVAARTHLRGWVGVVCDKKREVSEQVKNYA